MSATSPRSSRPLLAFTSGDPAGIGPETVVAALRGPRLRRVCRAVLVGERRVWLRAGWRESLAPLFDTNLGIKPPPYGATSAEAGAASFAAVKAAFSLAARGIVDGVVTAPISKQGWSLAGISFTDHTEFIRSFTGTEVEMVLGIPRRSVWCALATRHLPLVEAIRRLSLRRVVAAARSLDAALRRLGARKPRLVLCGLNPHAGEEGLIGGEERRVLIPASSTARREGLDLSGPLAADAAWRLHLAGKFDGVVCLYHDQALIPLKTAGGLGVVNWTVGSLIRTSPGHGTAFDIAGKGIAEMEATLAAAELAAGLARSGGPNSRRAEILLESAPRA